MRHSKLKSWATALYWVFALLFWEILVHAGIYGSFHSTFRFALGFTAAIALVVAMLVRCLPRKAVFPANLVLTIVMLLLYGSQLMYNFIFGTPYSVYQVGMGADALTTFWRETLNAAVDNYLWLLGLLVPPVLLVALRKSAGQQRPDLLRQLMLLLFAALLACGTYWDVCRGGTGMYSNYYFFTSTRSTTTQTMERFGIPMTFWLELTHTEEDSEEEDFLAVELPAESNESEEDSAVYNILDVDYDALNRATDNKKLTALNSYCARQTGTNQNEYTGIFRDYNLIVLCAESFSPAAVDPEITPTLYRLTHEGFLFRNYYNSFPNTTIDGEYALTQGLYPDAARGKENSSMLASSENLLPFTLAHLFEQQRGIRSWGYHNNIGSFYNRKLSHPNMGYMMQFNHDGMELGNSIPTSDLEMIKQTVGDYIDEPQFHAYYMTYSGHYQYKPDVNSMAANNYRLVQNLTQYDPVQRSYLACHIELDKALEYLMHRLEEKGILDKTVIVMASDHFPYGLQKNQYFGMLGQEEDFFSAYHSNLILWVGGMETPVEVDEYCCNVDILPTILNMWGFDYDSRMLAGTDIFSDGNHMAVLIDHSFLTDKAWFNSNTGEVFAQVPESELPSDYVDKMNRLVASRFDFSSEILANDYYRYVFEQ